MTIAPRFLDVRSVGRIPDRLILTGLTSDLPPSDGSFGFFWATDTSTLFFDSGPVGGGWLAMSAQIQARAFSSAAQSLPGNTVTALAFDTDDFDVGNLHDPVTNNSRFTVPAGQSGFYLIIGNATFAPNAAGRRLVAIRKNGITSFAFMVVPANADAATNTALPTSIGLPLVAGDFVEIVALQNSGGALNTVASTAGCFGELIRLR